MYCPSKEIILNRFKVNLGVVVKTVVQQLRQSNYSYWIIALLNL